MCLYHSYLDAIQALGDAERGRLLTAMLEYSITGAAPQLGGNERYIFPMVKAQIDRDREKYEEKCRKNAEKGRLGGRPPKAGKATAFSESPESQGKGKGEGAYAANAREAALGAVLSHYQDCITPTPPSTVAQLLIAYTDELGPDVVIHAIDEAVNQRKLTWSYIQAILQRYSREGLDTLAKVEADELAKSRCKTGKQAGGGNIFAQMIQEGDL